VGNIHQGARAGLVDKIYGLYLRQSDLETGQHFVELMNDCSVREENLAKNLSENHSKNLRLNSSLIGI
jgi:hypothetical protein